MPSTLTSVPSEPVLLPFRTLPAPADVEVIGNPTIGEITLPRYGSVTANELNAYRDRLAELPKDLSPGQEDSGLREIKVTTLFQSRVNRQWTTAHTLGSWTVEVNGEPVAIEPSEVLIRLICQFFDNELEEGKPSHGYSAIIQGRLTKEAKALAIAHAKEKGLVVVTNNNLESQAIYFLYERHLVPQGGVPKWRVVADHAGAQGFGKDDAGLVGAKKNLIG